MKHNFETALEMLLEHEGGYVNHPKDPGGETNLGKTLRALEDHNAQELVDLMYSRRQEFYENLTTFETFGKGWTRRNKKALKQSIKLM